MNSEDVSNVYLILFGVYLWDYLTSLWFEYRLLTKKIRFRWQFVPYFLARYLILALVILLTVTDSLLDFTKFSLCAQASIKTANLFLGFLGIVFSTWNLLVRTIIIWGHHPLVTKALFAVGLLHLVVPLVTAPIGRHACVPVPLSVQTILIFGSATAIIELAILVFTLVGIRRASHHGVSHLARLLLTQGIAYFVMVFLIHLTMIITSAVQPSPNYTVCIGMIGTIVGPLFSCRLVTSTLSQDHTGYNPAARTHRIECFELSEDPTQDPSSGQMTTRIDITKDSSVC